MSSVRKPVIEKQSRQIVFKVFQYFERTKSETDTLENIKIKTSQATGICVRTVDRIRKEATDSLKLENRVDFSSFGKRRRKLSSVTTLPAYRAELIRKRIYDFHKTEGMRVTVKVLLQKLREDSDFDGSETSLRRVLKTLGFKWRKTQNNRKLLIEKMDIRSLRIKYLQTIKSFREQGREIIYLDESYIHSGHTSSKNWSDKSNEGLHSNISKGQRLIMVHAGSDKGFIPNGLLLFKSGTKSGDYHSEMNAENYGKWLREKLIPNLPPNCVIVTDNAPYHNVLDNPAPTSNSKKADMINWLHDKNIPFHPNMLKPQLYELIKRHKKDHITYKFDILLRQHGHTVLRLPPYHPDLNPIELVWATVKNNVAKKNTTFKLDDVIKLTETEFDNFSSEEWCKRCQHVIKVEQEYLSKESFIDQWTDIDPVIINLGDDSESEDNDSSSDSD